MKRTMRSSTTNVLCAENRFVDVRNTNPNQRTTRNQYLGIAQFFWASWCRDSCQKEALITRTADNENTLHDDRQDERQIYLERNV
jgi:hypothetical protein